MGLRHFIRTILGSDVTLPHDYVASTLAFPELDVAQMQRRLHLADEGKRRGTGDEPATESVTLDDVEQRIITTIESEKRLAYETFRAHLKTYGDRLASLGFQTRFTQALATADGALSDLKAKVHIGVDILFQLRRDLVHIEDDLARFRHEHHLQRLPRYPPSRLWRWGVILLLFGLEGGLNGTFLARGHELGLLGGISEALAIAAINILYGLAVGWQVAPRMVHRRPLWKLVGVGGIVLYVGVMGGFNLAVAHYRTALAGEHPEQAPQHAWASLLAQPVGIEDMHAWFLFALGCMFSLGAALDGWSMDDPYPGYGRLARAQAELIDTYTEQKQEQMGELEAIRNDALERMAAATSGIERHRAEYWAILEGRACFTHAFRLHLDHLEQCGRDLLATYREANRRARQTLPPPHFAQQWDMPRPAEPAFGLAGDLGDPDLEGEIGRVFAQLHEKRQGIHTQYEQAMAEYQRIDELTPEVVRHGRLHSS